MVQDDPKTDFVLLGKISGHHGVRGWLKIRSYSRPKEEIFSYGTLLAVPVSEGVSSTELEIENFSSKAKNLLVKFSGFNSREECEILIGCSVGIVGSQLEGLPKGEYYWRDLIGMNVVDRMGEQLGTVEKLLETGANDVLVVETSIGTERRQELLIPWIESAIIDVDMDGNKIVVDWEVE